MSNAQNITLEEWKLFAQVAKLGSLTKTAALRGTAQPVISRQIALLERKCKIRLFDRNGRGVSLTEAGSRVLPRVDAWLSEADQIAGDVRARAGVPIGNVRIGMLASTGPLLGSLLFQQVRNRFPGIQLRLMESSSSQLAEWLKTGQIDIAILFRFGNDAGPDDRPIAKVDIVLVGSAKDTVVRPRTVAFSNLDGLPLILPPETNLLRRVLQQAARKKHVTLNVVMECDSLATQKEAVAEGGGHTVLGSNAVVQELKSGRLRASRIVSPSIQRTITLCVSPHRPPTLACREVAALIQDSFPKLISARSGR